MQAVKKFLLIWIAAFSALSSCGYALEGSLSLLFPVAVGKNLMTARQPPVEVTSTKVVYLEEGDAFPLSATQCIYTGIFSPPIPEPLPGQVLFPGFDPGASSVVTILQQGAGRQREIIETARQNRRLWLLRSCGESMDEVAGEYAEEENEMIEWWMLEEVLYEAEGSHEAKIRYEDSGNEGIPLQPDTCYCITPPLHNNPRTSSDVTCDGESDSEDDSSSDEKNDSDSKEAVSAVADPDCIITDVEPGFEVAPEIAAYCDALEWAAFKQEPESDDEMPIDPEIIITVEARSTTDDLVSPSPAKKRKLSGHLKTQRETVHEGKKEHVCNRTGANDQLCNQTFVRKSCLKTHIEIVHEGKKEHICDRSGADGQPCHQAFGHKASLKRHIKTVHEGKKEHVCDRTGANGQPCHQAFGLKSNLKRHIKTIHEGKKEHVCDWTGADGQLCNQAFGQKSYLKAHIETVHEGKKGHICDRTGADGQPCNKAFSQKGNLKTHIKTVHEGKKEYVCDWAGADDRSCNQEFCMKRSLKAHIETVHEGKKKYICDKTGADGQLCNKAFGQKGNLKTHIETVHEGKKEHVCDRSGADIQLCNQAFGRKSDLKRHMELVHEGKEKNRKHRRMEETDDQTADSQQH